MNQAEWTCILDEGSPRVLVVIDENRGARSVTNDIVNVVAQCHTHYNLDGTLMIYRDSMGYYCGVLTDLGHCIGFKSLGTEILDMDEAIRHARLLL